MLIKGITVIMSLSILFFVVELIRREKFTFKYAFSWIFISLAAIFFSVFDKTLFFLSSQIGFELPSNFIFFSLLSVMVFLVLLMTIFLCQQNRHNDTMAQKVALLEEEMKMLRGNVPGAVEEGVD